MHSITLPSYSINQLFMLSEKNTYLNLNTAQPHCQFKTGNRKATYFNTQPLRSLGNKVHIIHGKINQNGFYIHYY